MTNIDQGQSQKSGYQELALVTAGDDLATLSRFLKNGKTSYTAHDVIEHLLGTPLETNSQLGASPA